MDAKSSPFETPDSISSITSTNRNVYILAFVLMVVTLGFGVVIPIIPFYMENLGAGGTELGLLVASYALMRLIFAPLWGSISDRVGRKPVLIIGILGYGITMALFGLVTQLWMLFVVRSLAGILSSATSPTTLAYISDSTAESDRGRGMGILGAAVGLGTILGPGLGGLMGEGSYAVPFFIAGGMSLVGMLLIIVFLPESLSANARWKAQQQRKSNPIVDFSPILQVFNPRVLDSIGPLLGMAFLASFALTTFFGIFGLYALERFGYGPQEVGVVFMGVGAISALAQGVLTGPLTSRWGEAPVIKCSVIGTAIGFALMLAPDRFVGVLIVTGVFTLASALLTPAVMALTSKQTPFEQGLTMGVSNSFISLGRIAGPLLAGLLFDVQFNYPFVAGALVMLIGFVLALVSIKNPTQNLSGLPE